MKILSLLIFLLVSSHTFSQVPIGQWRSHIPKNNGFSVCEAQNKIFCLTETGVFYFNKSDNSVQKIGKTEGLSGINTSSIAYFAPTKTLFIGYTDGTIDLIENNNQITTLTDIKRKSYLTKQINKIQIIDDKVYFSTNFGIVVYDPYKLEFIETYIIGDNGYEIIVNCIGSDNKYLYAATEHGVRRALKSSSQLPNYAEWKLVDFVSEAKRLVNTLNIFNNKLVASYEKIEYGIIPETQEWGIIQYNETYVIDFSNNSYNILYPEFEKNTLNINIEDNKLCLVNKQHISLYENLTNPSQIISETVFSWGARTFKAKDAIIDTDNMLWYADETLGLVKNHYNNQIGSSKIPNGPKNNDAFYLSSGDNNIWLAAGALEANGANAWVDAGISRLENGFWKSYSSKNIPILKTVKDIIAIEQIPDNPDKIICSTGNSGVLEMDFTDDKNIIVTLHNDTTGSTLKPLYNHIVKVVESKLDKDLNLWSISPRTNRPISVKKKNGEWMDFPYGNPSLDYGKVIITEDNAKWIIIQRGYGLFVFNHNETLDDLDDDFAKQITVKTQDGEVYNDIFAMIEDKSQFIWLGTQNGIIVYYEPKKVYNTNQEGFYGSKIIIDINGKLEYLMEGKKVTALAVDGANRKWIGTEQSGIFLMSEDGTEQIFHFDSENSPLPSDKIKSISIDNTSGEVFIATSLGLMSYRAESTEGNEFFDDVYAFPNPVKPEYTGPIAIKGLIENTTVKITDIAGNLVTEMMSLGGQAIWDGKNLNGERVKTGIYLVFLSANEGENTQVTKILFIN